MACVAPHGVTSVFPTTISRHAPPALSSDGDLRCVGLTDRRGLCMNGPHTALAAVLPFGPAKAFDPGTPEVPRAGDARTPCRARPRLIRVALRFAPSEQPRVYAPCARRSLLRRPWPLPVLGTGQTFGNTARGDAHPLDSPAPAVTRGCTGQGEFTTTLNDGGLHAPVRPTHRRSRRPCPAAAALDACALADPAPAQLAARQQGQGHRAPHNAGACASVHLGVPLPARQPGQDLQARSAVLQRPACRCAHGALAGRGQGGPAGTQHAADLLLAPQDLHALDRQAEAAQAHLGVLRRPGALHAQLLRDRGQVLARDGC